MLTLRQHFIFAAATLAAATHLACTKSSAPPPVADLSTRGKSVYISNCIACHHTNPKQDGPLGPAIHGSSKELLKAKVLENKYPEGYKPKRATQVMVPLPQLSNDLDAIHSFLNQN